jgi:hypothetical protein
MSFWKLFEESEDRHKFVSDVSVFVTEDFGSQTSRMMNYQQAAMQFLKDFIENGCKEQADVF